MTEAQINKLVLEFTKKILPKSEWTHKAHIVVAFWHNWNFEFSIALDMVRQKIIRYNESVGTENTDTSGYHESLTVFWMILTKNYLSENNFQEIEDACSVFFKSENSLKNIPLEFYSKEILFNNKARKEWVNGNIKQIEITDKKTTANNG